MNQAKSPTPQSLQHQKLGVRKDYFAFSLVSEEKVLKYLLKISANKATGLDGIPARFIKDSASIVTVPIAQIINLSLITGVVPDDLKSAHVVPLFKKSDKTEIGHYRPVPILNIVSKVLERVIYDQFEGFLLQNKSYLNINLDLGEVSPLTLVLPI